MIKKTLPYITTAIAMIAILLAPISVWGNITTDAEGWTHITPSFDSRIVFVSSSEGNDSNDGLSPSTPKQTISAANALIRDGYPDHLLLKRGDVFQSSGIGAWKSGRNANERMVLSSYGESGPRPVIETSGNFLNHGGNVRSHLAIVGIEVYKPTADPNSGQFTGAHSSSAFRFVGGGDNILIEDCRLRYTNVIAQSWEPEEAPEQLYTNFEFRRNIVTDAWVNDSTPEDNENPKHTSGIFVSGVIGYTMEENFFDHNGWSPHSETTLANLFAHNVYIQRNNAPGGIIRGNISARGSSHGMQARSGGVIERNLFVNNAIGLGIGGVGHPTYPEVWDFENRAVQNVVIDGRNMHPTITAFPRTAAVWGIIGAYVGDVDVIDNIVANRIGDGVNIAIQARTHESPISFNLSDNIVYNWATSHGDQLDSFDPSWPDPDADLGDYMASIGGPNSTLAYYEAQRNRGPGEYPWELTAYAAINYIRAGFNKAPVSGYYDYPGAPSGGVSGPTGIINRDYWTGISGMTVASLTSHADFPDSPTGSDALTSFEAVDWNNPSVTSNWADNYGQRVFGYIYPPVSGDYVFWIASDDQSELHLSTNHEPANASLIAQVTGWTHQYQWNKYGGQKSATISLVAGQPYYIEALMKEQTAGDHLAVGWAKPGEPTSEPSEIIPGNVLAHELVALYTLGSITRDYWTGISGLSVSDLVNHQDFPNNPTGSDTLQSFEAVYWNNPSITSDWADNYGQRVYGHLHPPATGDYTFWIASDDQSELYLSTDEDPAKATLIAWVSGWTNPQQWNKYGGQKSVTIALEEGKAYYIEAIMKEQNSGDNLSVGWAKPGESTSSPSEVIPGSVLSPW